MRASRIVLLAAVFVAATPGFAWTAATRVRMIDDAVKMMPPTLRHVLESRRDSVLKGMLTPMTAEDAPPHRPPWDEGTLPTSVDAAARDLVAAVNGQISFREVARRFGALAHFVADAGFPPGAAGAAGAPHYAHFAAFCESRRGRFPLVFYGHDNAFLARRDAKAFTLAILERARAEDVTLSRAYAAASSWDDAAAFDDRSVPFAIASLSYSHSITDIVQAWLDTWRQCHGDLGGTPYMGPAATKGSTP